MVLTYGYFGSIPEVETVTDRLLWVVCRLTLEVRFRPNAVIKDCDYGSAKMVFDVIWNLILPFAVGRYRAIRIFIWTLLIVAAGLTFYYS